MKVDGRNVQLTPEQFRAYVELSGKAAKSYFNEFIKTREWRAMTDDERREAVKDALGEFRASARDELKQRYPDLAGTRPVGARRDEFVPPPPPPGFEPVGAAR